ncbi:phage tail tape measure protein [uncultured Draconibacterium sp.]|uniref:phage tail tape measure protein n=1 Tax=uncultured Draconibacterium sp. TaxID=1573823 RepID=UPI0025D590DD|nr:phage tail tape measure protein [uncultured Draconibacterium sp.]
MSGKVTQEEVQLRITVGGNQAKKELGQLEQQARELTQEQKALRAEKAKLNKDVAAEKKQITALNKELKVNREALEKNKDRQAALRKEIGLTGLTMRQLNMHIKTLQYHLHNATPGTEEWKRYNAELTKAIAHKQRLQKGVTVMGQAMRRAATTVNHYAGMMMAAGFAVYKVYDTFIQGNAKLSDQLSDVEKHTNLTRKELNALYLDLRKADTRTSREELLKLASVAGKLGIEGRQNILEFVKASDQITVALGEDMGQSADEAVKMVGKIVDVFDLDKIYGIEQAMLKAGSAVNTLGQSSSANEGYIVEWTNRVQGIAKTAGIAMTDVMGLASANDQLAQSAEVSSTVFTQIVPNMFKDTATYAKVAGMEVGDFTKLLKTDANEAFIALLDGLNGNNDSLDTMTQKLDGLGLDGKRVISVLLALARDTDKIREAQDIANESFKQGTSITDEFSKKNENLAGNLAKIGKRLKELTTNFALESWLTSVTGKFAGMITKTQTERVLKLADNLKKLERQFADQNDTVDKLLITYDELKDKQTLTKDEQELLNETIRKIGEIVPTAISEFNKYGEAVGINKTKIMEAREAQRLLNLEMKQDVIEDLVKNIDKQNESITRANGSIEARQKLLADEDLMTKTIAYSGKTREEIEKTNLLAIKDQNDVIKQNNVELAQSILKLKDIGLTEEEISTKTGISIEKMTDIVNKYIETINKAPGEINAPDTNDEDMGAGAISKKQLKSQEELLEQSFTARQNIVKEQYLQEKITQDEYNNQMYVLEQAHLIALRELYKKNGNDISEIQSDILDKRIEHAKKMVKQVTEESQAAIDIAMSIQTDEEEETFDPATNAEIQNFLQTQEFKELLLKDKRDQGLISEAEYLQKLERLRQQYANKEKDRLEIIQETADARLEIKEIELAAIGEVSGALSGMVEEGSAAYYALFGIEKAMAIAQVWLNYAKESAAIAAAAAEMNAVSFGIAGTAWGLVQQAKAKTRAIANTALIATQSIAALAQKRDGGYATVYGADDGRQYRARVLTQAGTGMLPNNPVVMPSGILASEAGQEYYVDNRSLSSEVRDAMGLRIADHVAMIDAMKNNTVLTQRIAGGYSPQPKIVKEVANQGQDPTQPYTSGMDKETAEELTKALKAFTNKKLVVYSELIKKDLELLDQIEKES